MAGRERRTDGVAVAALVLGIIGLLASLIPFGLLLGVPLGVAAIVCGIIGLRRRLQRGLAIGGLVTGVLSLLVAAAYVVAFLAVVEAGSTGAFDEVIDEALQRIAGVSASSPCPADQAETVTPTAVETPADIRVHAVEACPDAVGDILWAVELENTGAESESVMLRAVPAPTGATGGEPATASATLRPAERTWVEILTVDEWQTPLRVELQVTQG